MEIVLLVGVGRGVGAEALARGLFLAEDQLNLTGWNPLIGANFDEYGPRFPDMSEAFDSRLRRTALDLARRSAVPVRAGIFAGVSQARWDWLMRMGPADQEVELGLFRKAGADMVGVGLVSEAIVARHMGVRVLGMARDTNDRSSGAAIAPLIRELVKEL
jgi:purine-nucleoside phosphorylase